MATLLRDSGQHEATLSRQCVRVSVQGINTFTLGSGYPASEQADRHGTLSGPVPAYAPRPWHSALLSVVSAWPDLLKDLLRTWDRS